MGRGKILAVDDDEHFLQLLNRSLGEEGYEVRTASSEEEALSSLDRERFDLP